MILVIELRPGHVVMSKLLGEKQVIPRIVVKAKPRTGLTYLETQQKNNRNAREVFELPSTMKVATT